MGGQFDNLRFVIIGILAVALPTLGEPPEGAFISFKNRQIFGEMGKCACSSLSDFFYPNFDTLLF